MPHLSSDSQQCSGLPLGSIRSAASQDLERPDSGWDTHSSCLGIAIFYVYASCIFIGFDVFVSWEAGSAPLNSIRNSAMLIPSVIYCFYCTVLCSLAIEVAVGQDRSWLRRLLQLPIVSLFISGYISCGILAIQKLQLIFAAGIGVYIIGALIHRAIGWSKR